MKMTQDLHVIYGNLIFGSTPAEILRPGTLVEKHCSSLFVSSGKKSLLCRFRGFLSTRLKVQI